jgi:amino acid permease
MAKNILGVPGKIVVNIALLIGSWGAMILLFLVVKEQVYILLQKATSDIKVEDWVFLLGVALGISFPLSFFHQYDKYAVSSILGVVMVFWVFFTILVTAPWSSLETNVKQYPTDFIVASAVLPLFAYAHNNIWAFLTILHYMDRPTREDIGFLIVASNTITTIILTFIGVVGYLSFGDRTSSVIINSMKYDGWRDVVVIICRILVATQFALAIPICVQVIRSSLFATRFAVWVRLDKHPLFNHIWVTTLSFGTALLIACFKVDTSTIQGIVTAITFSSASLIVPAVLDWHYWGKVESKKAPLCRVFVCIICTIGCAIFILGFVTNCFPQSIPKAQFTNQLSRILSRPASRKIPPEFKHLLEAVDLIPNDFQS